MRIEDAPPRDGTIWRGRFISALRSPAIHPWPDRLYYGRGPDVVAGYRWFETEDGRAVVALPESQLERLG